MPFFLMILAGLVLAISIGFSILGQGGGVLYMTVQLFMGIDFHTAATTSLFLIMLLSLSSSLVFKRAGKIDWRLAVVLETTTSAGGFAGGLASNLFADRSLVLLFSAVLTVAGIFMIRSLDRKVECPETGNGFLVWRRRLGGRSYCVNLALALPVSFAAGLASGLVGVGGGVLKVPMMVLLLGVPMDIAVGSSALMVGMTAGGGFAGHVVAGHWDWRTSLVLGAVVFLGGQIGSRIGIRLDKRRMKRGFGWFLLGIAAVMVLRSLL